MYVKNVSPTQNSEKDRKTGKAYKYKTSSNLLWITVHVLCFDVTFENYQTNLKPDLVSGYKI